MESEGAATQICLDFVFNINLFVFYPNSVLHLPKSFPNAPKAAGISGPPLHENTDFTLEFSMEIWDFWGMGSSTDWECPNETPDVEFDFLGAEIRMEYFMF